jgi:hypothetical protein
VDSGRTNSTWAASTAQTSASRNKEPFVTRAFIVFFPSLYLPLAAENVIRAVAQRYGTICHSQDFAQEPGKPDVGGTQASEPSSSTDVGNRTEDAPGGEVGQRRGDKGVGQQTAQERGGTVELTTALEGAQASGLLFQVSREAGNDLTFPAKSVWFFGMMGVARQGKPPFGVLVW